MTLSLQPFDGREVRRTAISITNAGDGLSQSLKIDPKELHIGETVFVVLECSVAKLRFVPIDDGDDLVREHILKAGTGTLVDKDLVEAVIAEARDRIIAAQEQEKGIQQIDPEGEAGTIDVQTLERLREGHELGNHKRPRKDCVACQAQEREKNAARDAGKAKNASKKATGAKKSPAKKRTAKQTGAKKETGRALMSVPAGDDPALRT